MARHLTLDLNDPADEAEARRLLGLAGKPAQKRAPQQPAGSGGGHYCLALDGHTAAANELLDSVKARCRLKKRDRIAVGEAAARAGIAPATGKRRVRLTVLVGPGKRRPDPDAFWKSLLDAMAACGLLVNDSTA